MRRFSEELPRGDLPTAQELQPRIWAASVLQRILLNAMPRALNQQRATRRARSMRAIAVNIPFIHIMQASIERDRRAACKVSGGVPRLVLQFKIRMKRGEMQRHIRPEIFKDPSASSRNSPEASFNVGIIRFVISNQHSFRSSATSAYRAPAANA